MLVKANEVLLDKIDELERSCAYNGKYVQRIVAGVEVDDLYVELGKLKTYSSYNDTHSTVELDEDGKFDLEVHLVTYEDVTEQLVGG